MECPNCSSNKVKMVPRAWAICFLVGGLVSWIPIIGWFFGPLLILASPVVYLVERGKRSVQCNECKTRWYIQKEDLHEWQSTVLKKSK